MLEVVLATRNRGKIREIEAFLKNENIHVLSLNDFPEVLHVDEEGKTFRDNALRKARYAARLTQKLAIADDSGLEVDALDGHPGVFSARFAGEKATDPQNNDKLLHALRDVPSEKRGASFRCVLVLVEPSGEDTVIEEECRGVILSKKRGQRGFGYDPLFFYPPYDRTFAELTGAEKNRVSHRGKALRRLREVLRQMAQGRGSG